jgi:serine/threonine-protein kinase
VGSLEGKKLGHFRVERLLGSGGMGAVYEAVDEQLERQVALKVLLRDGDSALNQKRFLREARLAAKLTHPNIATVFEVGEFESHLYIVMELLEGQSLRKLLMTQRLKPEETFGIARDIARALARAHSAGVTHRDIKPENVFITTPSPNALHAKVLDFGLARQQKDAPRVVLPRKEEATETTAPGDLLGTPGYWSPEQARSGDVDVRTDIFSFGIVLYEMIAGRQAFKANSTVALVLAVTRHEPEPLRKYAPNVAPELEAIVNKCIAKDPSLRFADGNALLDAIEAIPRATPRASVADFEDTAADERGPPVVPVVPIAPLSAPGSSPRPAVPKPRDSAPFGSPFGAFAPTPGGTSFDDPALLERPVDRFKVFAAVGAGCAVAGILLILITVMWGGKDRGKASGAGAASSQAAVVAPPPTMVTPPLPEVAPVEPPAAPAEPAPSAVTAATPPSAAASTVAAPHMIPTPLATDTPVATSSAAIAVVGTPPPRSTAPSGSAARKDRKADCGQPYTLDAKGNRIPKLHCL